MEPSSGKVARFKRNKLQHGLMTHGNLSRCMGEKDNNKATCCSDQGLDRVYGEGSMTFPRRLFRSYSADRTGGAHYLAIAKDVQLELRDFRQ